MAVNLKDKVILVTGAGGGIGRAACKILAGYGAKIAAVDINAAGLEKTKNAVADGEILLLEADITDQAQVKKAVADTVERYGRIDVLYNNAGIVGSCPLTELSQSEWDRVMNINLRGALFVAQETAKVMKQQGSGRIINQSSQAGHEGEYGNGAYCISKAGISMMSQVLALELAEFGIAVCSVSPGYTNSDLFRHAMSTRAPIEGSTAKEYTEQVLAAVPQKRAAEPDEIAELVAFLSDERSYYIHGSDVLISGGKVMH